MEEKALYDSARWTLPNKPSLEHRDVIAKNTGFRRKDVGQFVEEAMLCLARVSVINQQAGFVPPLNWKLSDALGGQVVFQFFR